MTPADRRRGARAVLAAMDPMATRDATDEELDALADDILRPNALLNDLPMIEHAGPHQFEVTTKLPPIHKERYEWPKMVDGMRDNVRDWMLRYNRNCAGLRPRKRNGT